MFRRERSIADLDAWSALNEDVHIRGALPAQADAKVGYVTLGDVRFLNRVLVGTSRQSDGNASFSYRETFYWQQGLEIIRQRHPRAQAEVLAHQLLRGMGILSDEGESDAEEEFEERLVATFPGFTLGINSSITFRLNMPGRITSSNAHDEDGSTLVWEFSPADALTAPIVVVAESVVGG